jgi:hypothetical protein
LQSGVRHDGSVLRLDDGTPIGFEAVQRLLCDAAVTGVLFANRGCQMVCVRGLFMK